MCNDKDNEGNIVFLELERLKSLIKEHLHLGKDMIEAYGGALYPTDILATAALNRSMKTLKGFILLIDSKNIMCAGSLLRLQIDSCIRFFASFIVNDPHAFALKVLEGEQINKMVDKSGNKMRDAYLVEKISFFAPWITNVYKETSGYIHLSKKHYYNCIRATDEDRCIELHITEKDQYVTDELYVEAIRAFECTTILLFEFIYGWTVTKENPQLIDRIKTEFINKYGREISIFDRIKVTKK